VYSHTLSNGRDFRTCGRPCEKHQISLRDRLELDHPVIVDVGCRNTVFNALPQSAAEYVGRMRDLGITRFRVELLRETPEQVGPLLGAYRRVITGTDDGRMTWRQLQALNQLGVTRGTLQLL
jgi:putative protease